MGLFGEIREIKKVKFLGVRTAEQTKILGTYNSSLYCLIVQYTDDTRVLIECDGKEFQKKYINYIDM